MLRLRPFRYHRPETVTEAVELLARHGEDAMLVAGGTDLVPNMKHGLFQPGHLVSLNRIRALRGISAMASPEESRPSDGGRRPGGRESPALGHLRIGALETLHDVSTHPDVRRRFPGLAAAAGLVAGPQLRNMGTIGGNICLDTRCTYYNQTAFWRGALGHCLKKDGDICHVTKTGKKCVAAHSADTPPNLIALGATLELAGPHGTRHVEAADFFVADGVRNTCRAPDEVVTNVRIPFGPRGARSAYQKLRQRKSIDFPLLSVAVAGEFAGDGSVASLKGVVSVLGARPRLLSGWEDLAAGKRLDARGIRRLAHRAWEQCRPLENVVGDAEWRRAMVPIYVARALQSLAPRLPGRN